MAGILNSKTRVIDFIITEQGREQAANGELQIKYATFSDRDTFYSSDLEGVAADADGRIFFEASGRSQDLIVVATTPQGSMKPFKTADFDLDGTNVVTGSFSYADTAASTLLTGSQYSALSSIIVDNVTQNFTDQMIIGQTDPFADSTDFLINQEDVTFEITDSSPIEEGKIKEASISAIESLFQDRRLSHLPNYKYLPPRNPPMLGNSTGRLLGRYANLSQANHMTLQNLQEDLKGKPWVNINFTDTSRDNNIVIQPFEFRHEGIQKLSIIDFGEFPDEDPVSPGKRVFFLGKIMKDHFGSSTFVNMFTVILD